MKKIIFRKIYRVESNGVIRCVLMFFAELGVNSTSHLKNLLHGLADIMSLHRDVAVTNKDNDRCTCYPKTEKHEKRVPSNFLHLFWDESTRFLG